MKTKAKKSAARAVAIDPWDGLLHDVPGFRTASLHCGLKTAKEEPPDLALLYCEQTCVAAGVFTQNRVCAAPVKLCRAHLKKGKHRVRALVINAGMANACTHGGTSIPPIATRPRALLVTLSTNERGMGHQHKK